MEDQIKHVAARLKVIFISFWLLPVLLIIVGETGGEWVGMYAADVRATYFAETLVILLAAICVPVSLKLFAWVLTRKIDKVSLHEILCCHSQLQCKVLSGTVSLFLIQGY